MNVNQGDEWLLNKNNKPVQRNRRSIYYICTYLVFSFELYAISNLSSRVLRCTRTPHFYRTLRLYMVEQGQSFASTIKRIHAGHQADRKRRFPAVLRTPAVIIYPITVIKIAHYISRDRPRPDLLLLSIMLSFIVLRFH